MMNSGTIKFIANSAVFLIAALSISGTAMGQSGNTAWTEKLSDQLAKERQCEVAFFTQLVETTKNGKPYYSARAQCVDGSQFDGVRLGDKEPFTIKTCEVKVC